MLSTIVRTTPSLLACTTPRAVLSTSQRLFRPISTGATSGASAPTTGWSWSKLSPAAQRNIKIAFGVGAVTDAYVAYHYFPDMFGKTVAEKK